MSTVKSEFVEVAKPNINFQIREAVSCLQAGLENTLKEVYERAGSKIQLEKREEVERGVNDTNRLLEALKNRYV